jgi:hypothetical protein
MSHRCGSILLLSVVLAGYAHNLSAQTAAVQVQVYDYADLKPGPLHGVGALMQGILAGAGLTVEVKLCRGNGAMSCAGDTGSIKSVVIRVVPGGPKTRDNVSRPTLGRSFAGPDGGTYATVFLGRVQDAAAEANVPWEIVTAYAAVHEAGHLLLGSEAHTARGLMKANWDLKDYEAMNQHQLRFSDEQARQLAGYVDRSLSANLGAGPLPKRR